MSVLKKNELMEKLKQIIGEKTDDETLTFIEDVNDTFDDKSKNENSEEDWKKKYEENDAAWRTKYKERFFSGESKEQPDKKDESQDDEDKPLTYDALFTEEKK